MDKDLQKKILSIISKDRGGVAIDQIQDELGEADFSKVQYYMDQLRNSVNLTMNDFEVEVYTLNIKGRDTLHGSGENEPRERI